MAKRRIPYDTETRKALTKSFIENVVFAQYRQLTGWQKVTGQSAQLDSGYLAQHLVSLISGVPGRGPGSRGKGDDLVDGSEIKAASTIGAVDTPRWNHSSLGTGDNVAKYLKHPYIYFALFDTAERGKEAPLRIRVWRVAPARDEPFRNVVRRWKRGRTKGNFQLQPPRWQEGSLVTNEGGNLILPIVFQAVQREIEGVDFMDIDTWNPRAGKSKVVARVP